MENVYQDIPKSLRGEEDVINVDKRTVATCNATYAMKQIYAGDD